MSLVLAAGGRYVGLGGAVVGGFGATAGVAFDGGVRDVGRLASVAAVLPAPGPLAEDVADATSDEGSVEEAPSDGLDAVAAATAVGSDAVDVVVCAAVAVDAAVAVSAAFAAAGASPAIGPTPPRVARTAAAPAPLSAAMPSKTHGARDLRGGAKPTGTAVAGGSSARPEDGGRDDCPRRAGGESEMGRAGAL
ncbi:MAG: hypothetical protein HOW73_49635 [Polyangiaceae bacterium]|nr:hypothetical protein [Polyangiaceae bacterium]